MADKLAAAMRANPHMRVHVDCGYHDLATPYFAAEHSFAHLAIPAELAANIDFSYYEAGHMMYLHEPSRLAQSQQLARFVTRGRHKPRWPCRRPGQPGGLADPRLACVSIAPAVEIDDLVKRYRDKTAVAGLSLRAQRGQVTAILGPNGAGKTTTIETCEGYRQAGRRHRPGARPRPDGRRARSCGPGSASCCSPAACRLPREPASTCG